MLELQKLYNHLEYEYNEDLDYIDEIYLYLHIKRLLSEDVSEEIIMKEMELLDNGKFISLKYENIELDTLYELLQKYTLEKDNLKKMINEKLKKYKKNIDDLLKIHNNIHNNSVMDLQLYENNEKKMNILNHKLELWWNWINNNTIQSMIKNKKTDKEDKYKQSICKRIFKYLNIINKLNNINEYCYKLIIYDIKHFGKKNLSEYPLDLLKNCCIYLNNKLQKCYPNTFSDININTYDEISNYLLVYENLYELDEEKNIIIFKITEDVELFHNLNKSYNIYKTIKLLLKNQYDTNQDIELTDDLNIYFTNLYEIIYKLDENINNEFIHNEIYKELELDESVKNKYYVFVDYLNNILSLVFQYYFENKLKKNSMIYQCLQKKYTILSKNRNIYKDKL